MEIEGYFSARVKILVAQRGLSEVLRRLDAGVHAVGVPKHMTISFKQGEKVNEARVHKAMDEAISAMARKNTEQEIVHYEIVEIVFIPKLEGGEDGE